MSSTLGASLLRTVLSDGTLKILGSGLDKGPIIKEPELSLMGMNTEEMAKPELREISQRIYHAFREKFGNRHLL